MAEFRRLVLGIGVALGCIITPSLAHPLPAPVSANRVLSSNRHYSRNQSAAAVCFIFCNADLCADDPDLCTDDDSVVAEESLLYENGTLRASYQYASSRIFYPELYDGKGSFAIKSTSYPQNKYLRDDDTGYADFVIPFGFTYEDPGDCFNWKLGKVDYPEDMTGWVTEHILELQTIKMFIQSAVTGVLPSGALTQTGPTVSADWFRTWWNLDALPYGLSNIGVGDQSPRSPNGRVFEVLGSVSNRAKLVIANRELNAVKARIWGGIRPRSDESFDGAVENWLSADSCGSSAVFLKYIRATMVVIQYLYDQGFINTFFNDGQNQVLDELKIVDENLWAGVSLADKWEEYVCNFIFDRQRTVESWLTDKFTYITNRIDETAEEDRPADWQQVKDIVEKLKADQGDLGKLVCVF